MPLTLLGVGGANLLYFLVTFHLFRYILGCENFFGKKIMVGAPEPIFFLPIARFLKNHILSSGHQILQVRKKLYKTKNLHFDIIFYNKCGLRFELQSLLQLLELKNPFFCLGPF